MPRGSRSAASRPASRPSPRPFGPAGAHGSDGDHGRRGSRGLGCGTRHGQRPDRSLQRGELGALPACCPAGPHPRCPPAPADGALRLRDQAVPGLFHHSE
ncbi:CHCHD10 isoform 5 [Pan troglodytes]|uniref:Coiled-coil-helix-coiled-coil-helix domain containing 10 n=2 Tax=Homininae TaxID=207598 RepID=E5RGN4_HUMAN|nr:CHCHD10 isoform 5 [Pan troglodytes]